MFIPTLCAIYCELDTLILEEVRLQLFDTSGRVQREVNA